MSVVPLLLSSRHVWDCASMCGIFLHTYVRTYTDMMRAGQDYGQKETQIGNQRSETTAASLDFSNIRTYVH